MHLNRKNEIIYFDDRVHSNDFFHLAMAGHSLPNPNYFICHSEKTGTLWQRYNFEYVVSGKGYIETRDRTYTVSRGDLFFLNKFQQHTYYADKQDPFEKMFVALEGNLVEKLLEAHRVTADTIVVHLDAQAVFERIFALADSHGGAFIDDESYSALTELVLKLIGMISPPDFQVSASENSPAAVVKNLIDYNIYDRITLSDMANAAHLSVSQTERVFKAKYGMSPVKYTLRKKLDFAKLLFTTTYMNVEEVSKMLSFSDPKYFSRLFKEQFKCPPSVYRKRMANDSFHYEESSGQDPEKE